MLVLGGNVRWHRRKVLIKLGNSYVKNFFFLFFLKHIHWVSYIGILQRKIWLLFLERVYTTTRLLTNYTRRLSKPGLVYSDIYFALICVKGSGSLFGPVPSHTLKNVRSVTWSNKIGTSAIFAFTYLNPETMDTTFSCSGYGLTITSNFSSRS